MQRLSGPPPLPHQEASSSSSKAKGACLSAARTDLADDASVTGRGSEVVVLVVLVVLVVVVVVLLSS